jgi:hypothetical protein
MKMLDLLLKCSCKPEIVSRERNQMESWENLRRECSRDWARCDKRGQNSFRTIWLHQSLRRMKIRIP